MNLDDKLRRPLRDPSAVNLERVNYELEKKVSELSSKLTGVELEAYQLREADKAKDTEIERLREANKAQADEIGYLTVQLATAKAPEPPKVYETATDVKPYTGGDPGITVNWKRAKELWERVHDVENFYRREDAEEPPESVTTVGETPRPPRPELPIGMAWCDKHQVSYPLTNPPRCPMCELEKLGDHIRSASSEMGKDAKIAYLIDLLTRCRGAVKNEFVGWRAATYPPQPIKAQLVAQTAALLEEVDKVTGEDK